jgi:hypothetical protein
MSSMARSTWRPWGWRLSIIVNSSPLRRADPSPRDNVSVVEDAIDPKAVSSEATMMAPDRPAEADPLDHGRESVGFGIDDTMTSKGLDVTPRRISTEYGLSMAMKTRSINRRPPDDPADDGSPRCTYLYCMSSRCTSAMWRPRHQLDR